MKKSGSARRILKRIVIMLLLFVTVMFSFSCARNTTEFTVVIQNVDKTEISNDNLEALKSALLVRLDAFYVDKKSVEFTVNSDNSLSVRINSQVLSSDALSVIVSNDIITFRDNGGNVFMDGKDLSGVAIDFDPENSPGENGCFIKLSFTDVGSDKFLSQSRIVAALTDSNDKFIGIYCGDEKVSSPQITSAIITNDIMLTGNDYTIESVTLLYQKLFCALNALPLTVSLLE